MLIIADPGSIGPTAPMLAMFEARKRVFVDLLGWELRVVAGRYEIDRFDDAHARYLILRDAEYGHLASARLLPSIRPHILGDLFPELCAGDPPKGPGVFEITRFCLERGLTARHRREARNRLVSALADYALANAITTYTGVAEQGWLEQIAAFGWRCQLLATPGKSGGASLGAFRIEIGPDTPALLTATGIYTSQAPARVDHEAA